VDAADERRRSLPFGHVDEGSVGIVDEYERYLAWLWNQHVVGQLPTVLGRGRRLHEWDYEFNHALEQLRAANAVASAVATGLDPGAIRPWSLSRIALGVAGAIEFNQRLLVESGIETVLQSDYEVIATGLTVDALPDAEREALRAAGFSNTADNLEAIIYVVRRRAELDSQRHQEVPPTTAPSTAVRLLREDAERLDELQQFEDASTAQREQEETKGYRPSQQDERAQASRQPRRWFKGVGQIAQGAAMSIADVALAAGALKFNVSDETKGWGALASVTAGVGTIASGIGDLRGE
jgi:hypothetical protein